MIEKIEKRNLEDNKTDMWQPTDEQLKIDKKIIVEDDLTQSTSIPIDNQLKNNNIENDEQ